MSCVPRPRPGAGSFDCSGSHESESRRFRASRNAYHSDRWLRESTPVAAAVPVARWWLFFLKLFKSLGIGLTSYLFTGLTIVSYRRSAGTGLRPRVSEYLAKS